MTQEGSGRAKSAHVEVEDDGDAYLAVQPQQVADGEHAAAVVVLNRQPSLQPRAQPAP